MERNTAATAGLIFGRLFDKTDAVVDYTGDAAEATIPAIHEGVPVTGIEAEAFCRCEHLTGVTIPDSVTFIGDSAFFGCKSLSRISLPAGVNAIGNGAFDGCDSLTIHCAVRWKPRLWSKNWNLDQLPVVWGCRA